MTPTRAMSNASVRRHGLVETVLLLRLGEWIKGDSAVPAAQRTQARAQCDGGISTNADIISMPDKWEYPWYAAWDLAVHCIPLALVDSEFAKSQLTLLTREWYMHPNGQLPAYEWAFAT